MRYTWAYPKASCKISRADFYVTEEVGRCPLFLVLVVLHSVVLRSFVLNECLNG